MCFSQYAQYAPRPVYEYEQPERPEGAEPTKAELDQNLYGPIPLPPEWRQRSSEDRVHNHHTHDHHQTAETPTAAATAVHVADTQTNGSAGITSVKTQNVEAVVVELSNGTKLLICPL